MTACWCSLPALFWLSSYVASHHLAMAQQSTAKDQFYCTVYYVTLNSNLDAQGVSIILKLWKIELKAKIKATVI
jgi:hypothetical protein